MEKNKLPEKEIEEVKSEVIKMGFAGILLFALSIGGAVTSHYLSYLPDYGVLRIVILVVSVILFLLGCGVLYFFRDFYELYTLMKDNNEDDEDE